MYLKYFNLSYILGFLAILTSPALPQESNINQMFQSEFLEEKFDLSLSLEVLQGLRDQQSDVFNLPSTSSLDATSKQVFKDENQLNSIRETDLKTDQSKISKIEQYYQLLTPQIMPVFGQESFASNDDNNILFYNTVEKNYKLAPGDVLKVTIRGLNTIDKEVQISQFGDITLPNLIPINVDGLELEEVEKKILNQVKIDDSSAFIDIALVAARLIPIQITGAAKFPQTLAVPAYTPLSRVIQKFGGIRKDGSIRNITLVDSSKAKKVIDLYDLLRGNHKFDDPILTSATRIHINDIGLTVGVAGFVGRPGIFELPKNIDKIKVAELLELANAKMIPYGATLEIINFDSNGVVQKQKIKNLEDKTIYAGEVLNVILPLTSNVDRISVQGAVLSAYIINASAEQSLASILKYGATLKDDALLDFAIIKSPNTVQRPPRSIDLSFAFAEPDKVLVKPGESIIILNSRLHDLILSQENNDFEQQQEKEADPKNLKDEIEWLIKFLEVEKLLRSTQKVYVDDKIVSLLPDLPNNSLTHAINERISLPGDLNLDYALKIENFGKTNKKVTSFSPKDAFNNNGESFFSTSLVNKSNIKLFSNKYLLSMLSRGQEQISSNFSTLKSTAEIEMTKPVEIFIDEKLTHIISKNTHFRHSKAFDLLVKNEDIYPFFSRVLKIKNSDNQVIPAPQYSPLLDIANEKGNLSKVELFTNDFVRQLFNDKEINLTKTLKDNRINQMGLNQMGLNQMGLNQMGLNQIESNQMGLNQIESNQIESNQTEFNQTNDKNELEPGSKIEFKHYSAFKRNSKLISGALEKPGFYPIIGAVNLEDLISIAGGLLPGADKENVTVREYGHSNGETLITGTKYIDITSIHPKQIILNGNYNVYIPNLVNNADVGTIEIEGEVQHPGIYTFSRDETLEEVLYRAGGFTKTAYPLGASFHRESLKNVQKMTNANLAREVEQSILFLSQSQLSGAGDQIKAVVAYANQLKNMPATGKQTLNIEGTSKTMLLEDGDKLIIPKRPSHVSISGSVQSPVTTVYEPRKSLYDYIADAGGFKRIADKKNVFVLLPNGKNITLSLLQQEGTIIPAGSVVVVPPKTDKISALGLTDIWSRVLGNIATSILAINAATK